METIEGKVLETKIDEGKRFVKIESEQGWILIEDGIINQGVDLNKLEGEKIFYSASERPDQSIVYGLIIGEGNSVKNYQFTKIRN